MGFCRRCGDITVGPRCKCGGTAVAPSVPFNRDAIPDRWSQTYVAKNSTAESSGVPRVGSPTKIPTQMTGTARRFPRPLDQAPTKVSLNNHVSEHIRSTLDQKPRGPPTSAAPPRNPDSPSAADILPCPDSSTLTKAYGSVLQPKETLATFSCCICSVPFQAEATLYPDPKEPNTNTRFLCKACFTQNGGCKGNCAGCSKPVLILKSEGSFVENSGKIWHKRCFRCNECFKDIGDNPMVDLLGRPSCEDCFSTCLKRPSRDSPRPLPITPDSKERKSNLGGMMKGSSRESSPTLAELSERLGIGSGESSPALHFLRNSSSRASLRSETSAPATPSPLRARTPRQSTLSSQLPKEDRDSPRNLGVSPERAFDAAVDSMKKRFLQELHTEPLESLKLSPQFTGRSRARSFSSQTSSSICPPTPDLMSDYSDNTSVSSPSTPPSIAKLSPIQGSPAHTPTPKSKARWSIESKTPGSPFSLCAECSQPLSKVQGGGRFVTVPAESAKRLPPKSFHAECFRCAVCDETFQESRNGQAVFVRSSTGFCHVDCATPERIVVCPISVTSPSKQYEPPPKTAPPTTTSFPRFGSSTTCPGCFKSVSPMERGVIPGPQGSRWHSACLVCGGKGSRGRRDANKPGCGKQLDSAAKSDGNGGVWCRECLLLVPHRDVEGSFTGAPLAPMHTGSMFSRSRPNSTILATQLTGTTTIARQFTGLGSGGSLISQMTGGGLSPTRQLMSRSPSPTKHASRRPFPRPKSVVGVRSVDEQRNSLVRQITGGSSRFRL